MSTYRNSNVYNRVCCNEAAGVVVGIDVLRLGHEIQHPFNEEWLRKSEEGITKAWQNTSNECPFIMRSEGPQQCVGSVFVGLSLSDFHHVEPTDCILTVLPFFNKILGIRRFFNVFVQVGQGLDGKGCL